MNASYTALLLTSCIALSLHSMEHETSLSCSTLANLTAMHTYDIKDLYHRTYEKLPLFTPNNDTAAINLLEIIERTNHLKSQGITEHHIGAFAFKQSIPFKNHVLYHVNPPYNGPHYISIFFERLKTYYDFLKKKEFTSPTIEQYKDYQNNQKINTAITQASSFGLHIDIAPLKEQNTFKNIPDTVAAQEFYKLIADIHAMRCKSTTEIEAIATLLYGPVTAKK